MKSAKPKKRTFIESNESPSSKRCFNKVGISKSLATYTCFKILRTEPFYEEIFNYGNNLACYTVFCVDSTSMD